MTVGDGKHLSLLNLENVSFYSLVGNTVLLG
jgi:hypothetical protein